MSAASTQLSPHTPEADSPGTYNLVDTTLAISAFDQTALTVMAIGGIPEPLMVSAGVLPS